MVMIMILRDGRNMSGSVGRRFDVFNGMKVMADAEEKKVNLQSLIT